MNIIYARDPEGFIKYIPLNENINLSKADGEYGSKPLLQTKLFESLDFAVINDKALKQLKIGEKK